MRSLIITLLLFITVDAFAQLPEDVNFIGFTWKKPVGDTLFRSPNDKDSLPKFFKIYNAHSLPVMIKAGQAEVALSCNEFIGLCLKASQHSKVVIRTRLMNKDGISEFSIDITQRLNEYVKRVDKSQSDFWTYRTKSKTGPTAKNEIQDIFIINLFEELIRQFMEPPPTDMACCPEKYATNARQEAIRKICEIFSIKNGIEVEVFNADSTSQAKYYNSVAYFNAPMMDANDDQNRTPQVDPRKYVIIQEQRNDAERPETVWNDDRYTKHILDSRSQVKIGFKLDDLRDEIYFRGSISLMAKINDGDPIEIESFSVIGKDFSKVGTRSQSPFDFALSFLTEMNNIYELSKEATFKSLDTALKQNNYNVRMQKWLANDGLKTKLVTAIDARLDARIKAAVKTSRWTIKLTQAETNFVHRFSKSAFYDSLSLEAHLSNPVADILDKLNTDKHMLSDSSQRKKEALINYLNDIMNRAKDTDPQLNDTDTVAIGIQLREFFYAAGREQLLKRIYADINKPHGISLADFRSLTATLDTTNTAASSVNGFIQNEYIFYIDYAIRHLKKTQDYLNMFLHTDDEAFFAVLTQINKDSLYLSHAAESIKDNLAKLIVLKNEMTIVAASLIGQDPISEAAKASIDEKIQRAVNELRRFTKTIEDLRNFEELEYKKARKRYNSIYNSFDKQEFHRLWARDLAIGAARHIYSKLITGTIRLSARTIQDDSKLTIYIIKFKPSGEAEPPHPIAEFRLRKLGWNESINDSFLLINRNGANAPDRFKGAYGVSLMWTYTSGEKADFFQRLQPSIGLNVAYVDFDTTQTFELGVGALVGFWKNKVFLGWGRNVHVKENPAYFSIGFSFANIASRIANLND